MSEEQIDESIKFLIEDKWVMKIDKAGVTFNRDEYKDYSPNDFAETVMEILEDMGMFEKFICDRALKISQEKEKE